MSTRYELERVIQAKNEGLPVTCGVTPHHLFLSENDETTLGAFGKMRPPLQPQSNIDYLWKNLSAIDCVESDHAPHTLEEKHSDNPPNGIPGLETTLPLLLTAVGEGRLTIDELIRLCHTGPAKILSLATDPTTLIEIDLDEKYILEQASLFSKTKWTPFNGWKMKGRLKKTSIRGKTVFENGTIIAKAGSGSIRMPSI
jgi:carbamoyl-phosphate synthase/aspartate carbamoyltransferase/dihydroorotase